MIVLANTANIVDRSGAEKLLLKVPELLWTRLEKILADGGYAGADFRGWVEHTFDVEFELSLRPTAHKGFFFVPFRGGGARTFAWLGRFRPLSKDCPPLVENSEGMAYLASSNRF